MLHNQGQAATSAPIRMFGSQTLTYLSHNDLHLVAVVKNNANVMMTMNWLASVRVCPPLHVSRTPTSIHLV